VLVVSRLHVAHRFLLSVKHLLAPLGRMQFGDPKSHLGELAARRPPYERHGIGRMG
jgi:hypothetical protein